MAPAKSIWKDITPKDIVWAIGIAITIVTHYYMLKMEVHDIATEMRSQLTIVNYRLDAIEKKPVKQTADLNTPETYAVLPNEIKFKIR